MSELSVISKSVAPSLTRTILVYNQPRQKAAKIVFNGTKWVEFAKLIENHPELGVSSVSDYQAVLASSQLTLEFPAAEIPEGDQKIFLYEKKVKSGATKKPETTSAYDSMSYNELRRLIKEKGIGEGLGSSPSRQSLVDRLENSAGVIKTPVTKNLPSGKVKTTVTKETPESAKEEIQKDREVLQNQPSLEQRISALELGFSKFISGMYEVCKDFVSVPEEKPIVVEAPKQGVILGDEIDLSELAKEARSIKS